MVLKEPSLSNDIVGVDLFCGVGGLTHGLRAAGIDIRAGFDMDKSCKFAYEENNEAEFIKIDVKELAPDMLRPHFVGAKYGVLAGCAPCQSFSALRKNRKEESGPGNRWGLLTHFARLAEIPEISVVSMENVPGLRHQRVYHDFIRALKKSGYHIGFSDVVNCADYGVPQSRKRLIVLASRLGEIRLVSPTFLKRHRTVQQALAKLRKGDPLHIYRSLSEKNQARIRQSKPGGSWRDWEPELVSPCHRKEQQDFPSPYGRMEWDKPAPTITTQFSFYSCGRFGHPEQDRPISVREGALLQGFSAAYKFIPEDDNPREKMDALTRGIGNAVPPPLGDAAIGTSIVNHFHNV